METEGLTLVHCVLTDHSFPRSLLLMLQLLWESGVREDVFLNFFFLLKSRYKRIMKKTIRNVD